MRIDELSEVNQTLVLTEGDLIAFISVELDQSPDSPLDPGGNRIVSLCAKHSSFDKEAFDEFKDDPDCVVLGYFEHGNCIWHVSSRKPMGTEGDYQWDGTAVAGLWIPGDDARAQLDEFKGALTRRKQALEMVASDCEVYTAWCNGWVYGWSVNVYKARHKDGRLYDREDDYRYSLALVDDSCWGYYLANKADQEYLLEAINNALNQ